MSFLRTAQDAISTATSSIVTLGAATVGGTLMGAAYGFVFVGLRWSRRPDGKKSAKEGPPKELTEQEKKNIARRRLRKKYADQLKTVSFIREVGPVLAQNLVTWEYELHKKLEALGYFPCPDCGFPHVDGGKEHADCLPNGTYFSDELDQFLTPEHPSWSAEEYEAWSGEPYVEEVEDEVPEEAVDDEPTETVH